MAFGAHVPSEAMALTPPAQLTPIEGIRRELQRTVRSYVTGQREMNGGVAPASDSWFGPDSITWLVHSDASTFIGGVESLLVQTLHPPGAQSRHRYDSRWPPVRSQ